MSDNIISPLSAHLRLLKQRSGLSLDQIAKYSSYRGKSSVQRFFETDDLVYIGPQVARKLAAAFYGTGDPPITVSDLAPLLGASVANDKALPVEALAHLLGVSINPLVEIEHEVLESRPRGLPVIGAAYASSWMESIHTIDTPAEWLFSHTAKIGDFYEDYALKIIGPSVNRVAKDGSYAICRQYDLALHLSQEGKFVHAQRERGGLTEWTIKKVKWVDDKPMLFPDSDHPDYQEPIPMGGKDGTVRIIGFVTGWYIPA